MAFPRHRLRVKVDFRAYQVAFQVYLAWVGWDLEAEIQIWRMPEAAECGNAPHCPVSRSNSRQSNREGITELQDEP
jgi:hypothetical protein